ncbi:MAG: hypothetical protein ABI557_07255 [Aureliella sp.]
MKLRDCVLLLASYELEGFPRTLPSQSARDLLNGWIAMWHPRLLSALEAAPRWQSAAQLPGELVQLRQQRAFAGERKRGPRIRLMKNGERP